MHARLLLQPCASTEDAAKKEAPLTRWLWQSSPSHQSVDQLPKLAAALHQGLLDVDDLPLSLFELNPLLHALVARLLHINGSVQVLNHMLKPSLCLVNLGQLPLEDVKGTLGCTVTVMLMKE